MKDILLLIIYIPFLFLGLFLLAYYPLRMISIMISTHYGAPYVPLPMSMIRSMFDLVNLSEDQLLYDLGSGDGRVLICAWEEYGARGVGFEVAWYPLILSWKNLKRNKLTDKITIRRADFFKQDISQADVIAIYQEPAIIDRLVPKFERELKDSAVVISPRFEVKAWPLGQVNREDKYPIYIYRMADVRLK